MRRIRDLRSDFLEFPETGIAHLLAGRRPIILAPHPDDESLGCGGLIASACAIGLAPAVVILTDGAASHPGSAVYPPNRLRALRERETAHAVSLLGLPGAKLHFLRAQDAALPRKGSAFQALLAQLVQIGQDQDCQLVIGPWGGDPHCDHEAGAVLAAACAAALGRDLLSYPVWGWLRDGADRVDEPRHRGWRLNITDALARKQAAIGAHQSQSGRLITDSPSGFQLPSALLAAASQNFEVFIA